MKKLAIIISVLSITMSLAAIKYFTILFDAKESATIVTEERKVEDYSDKKQLAAASKNIFLGEVLGETGSEKINGQLNTQFAVRVTQNIKGAFLGDITINQLGGYFKKGGKLYLLQFDQEPILKEGQMYLFATNPDSSKDWHNIVPRYGQTAIETEEQKYEILDEFKAILKE